MKYRCIKEGQYLLIKYNYKDEIYSFFKEYILSNYQYNCPHKTKKIDIDTYEIFINNINENTDEYILEVGLHLYVKEFCTDNTYIKKDFFIV